MRIRIIKVCAVIDIEARQGRIHLRARVLFMGQDICILLDGGQKPHMGAACTVFSSGQSAYCLPAHREDELAHRVAKHIHDTFACTATCLCGIHVPKISKDEIQVISAMVDRLILELTSKIQFFLRNPLP